jgi:hypothetical protein
MRQFGDMEIDDYMVPLAVAGHVRKLRDVEVDLIRYALAPYAGRPTRDGF